ncbi:hypothetical protein NUU61_008750 [Penicillium alfredii]|uniref:Kelch repeat protein n=1 Tax=Penicillium alfredii TaxID=1506179 RepID=A0A9W9ELV1_9EURO|nr:uncharacterized protein NUU61_008750 [Penicillium alfredii]KAJ5084171.1 hypothetical protein NUU61_008750 [Penicillium alfredii]
MVAIQAKWHKVVEAEILQRSSQVVSVVNQRAYIFGGELRPREPRDNDVHVLSLGEGQNPALSSAPSTSQPPSARVGTAAATLNNKLYLFSGRGGVAMAPIEEQGAVWEYDPESASWTLLAPADATAASPAARSYHCTTSDGADTIYVHAGCPEKGRLSDLWAFNVAQRQWTELAAAPDPPRGGTSIAFAGGKLFRMNGFDGKTEQGSNAWVSHSYAPDGKAGPTPRSVSALLPIVVGGRDYLVTCFGERDPSSLGHQGAGKMLSDVWAFEIDSKTWTQVETQGNELPAARGWFDADVDGKSSLVVQGGLGETNDRLGDVWRLEFS